MDDLKFGTSGLRGRVSALSDTVCHGYVRAFLQMLRDDLRNNAAEDTITEKTTLLVGYDLRPSSLQIVTSIVQAAEREGFYVENCGALPTPALSLAAFSRHLPAIMVTGSHIPADRNGLKFYRPNGEISKQDEQAILKNLTISPVELTTDRYLPPLSPSTLDAYKTRARMILSPQMLHGLKIGLYQQSCVGRDWLGDILAEYGAQILLFGRSQLFTPVDTEALSEDTMSLAAKIAKEKKLDAIVSTDGDGDRPLIAGRSGIYLRGDNVGLLCAAFLQADCVATPVTSSSLVESSQYFSQVYRCKVGSPYVLAEMARAKADGYAAIVGFEANGGVMLGSDVRLENGKILPALPTRDALLPILAVLGLAQKYGVNIDALSARLPARHTASGRLENVPQAATADFLACLADNTAHRHDFCQIFGIITTQDQIDGLRLILAEGDIIHYRASGNAPELRCYSESSTPARANTLVQKGLDFASCSLEKTNS